MTMVRDYSPIISYDLDEDLGDKEPTDPGVFFGVDDEDDDEDTVGLEEEEEEEDDNDEDEEY